MEYETISVPVYRQGEEIRDQFLVDDDYNVPDVKKDVGRVLLAEGRVRVDELKQADNYLRAAGELTVRILYMTDEESARPESLEGSFPFEEMIYIDEPLFERPFVKQAEADVTVTTIHSRKLSVKALLTLTVSSEGRESVELTRDLSGEETLYKRYAPAEYLRLAMIKRDTCRIREEVQIPGTKEAVGTLIWDEVKLRRLETRVTADQMLLQGELSFFALYESLEEKTDWVIQSIPFEGQLSLAGAADGMYDRSCPSLKDVLIDLAMDEDGEMRVLSLEATLEVRVILYEEMRENLLADVYALTADIETVCQETQMERALMQNHSKCKLTEQLHLPEIQNDILQICYSSGRIQLEKQEATETGVAVEGVLHLWFLYVRADDTQPFGVWSGMLPFSHMIESNECAADMRCELYTYVEQITVNLLGNAQVEVKAALAFQSLLTCPVSVKSIQEAVSTPFDPRELDKRPGMIGYVVRDGDDLWDLAKRYHTTVEQVMETNQKSDETLKTGEKLLIFKENMGIL